MTGSLDLREHIDRCACAGIHHAVIQLAALKNVTIPDHECAQIAGSVAYNLGAGGRARLIEAPCPETERSIIWQINNCLDWGAAKKLVDAYMRVREMELADLALGTAVDNVVKALKGHNRVGGPTWRWPDVAAVERAARTDANAWPLNPIRLGALIVPLEGGRA